MRPSDGVREPSGKAEAEPARRRTPTEEIDALIERLERIVGPDGAPDSRSRKPKP
ncbi:MAG: hypothetical protein L3J93_04840 [Thermoplasmata archaeon]|nr:hypothetical protein [Thermoplasmata archaeon]